MCDSKEEGGRRCPHSGNQARDLARREERYGVPVDDLPATWADPEKDRYDRLDDAASLNEPELALVFPRSTTAEKAEMLRNEVIAPSIVRKIMDDPTTPAVLRRVAASRLSAKCPEMSSHYAEHDPDATVRLLALESTDRDTLRAWALDSSHPRRAKEAGAVLSDPRVGTVRHATLEADQFERSMRDKPGFKSAPVAYRRGTEGERCALAASGLAVAVHDASHRVRRAAAAASPENALALRQDRARVVRETAVSTLRAVTPDEFRRVTKRDRHAHSLFLFADDPEVRRSAWSETSSPSKADLSRAWVEGEGLRGLICARWPESLTHDQREDVLASRDADAVKSVWPSCSARQRARVQREHPDFFDLLFS